jgi:hypothetical protein
MRGFGTLVVLGALIGGCSYLSEDDLAARMDLDGDGVARPEDCDDGDAGVGIAPFWYVDADEDGFGDSAAELVQRCEAASKLVENGGDCDDADAAIFPGADEYCNGRDDDCDEVVDEEPTVDGTSWYLDQDGDGFGDPSTAVEACSAPPERIADGTDCDDGDSGIHPGARDVCNGVDDDCNGLDDDLVWYADSDGDGYGDPSVLIYSCEQPSDYVADDQDCDDSAPDVNPEGVEICDDDDVDEDCDGLVDDEDGGTLGKRSFFRDGDGDGFGRERHMVYACDAPTGYAPSCCDCDDTDARVSPAAAELWYDGVDQDCDGLSDFDQDFDGHDAVEHGGGDCDDDDDAIHPGAYEACGDAIDNDCDGDQAGVCALNGELAYTEADVTLLGEDHDYSWPGEALLCNADLDGDGNDDLVIGAPGLNVTEGFSYDGGVYVVYGPVTADGDLSSADALIASDTASEQIGDNNEVLGDLNGDGFLELAIADYNRLEAAYNIGVVYIMAGPPLGTTSVADATAVLTGAAEYDYFGQSVAAAGDQDGDGFDDVYVGARGSDEMASGGGALYLFHGPLTGTLSPSGADASLFGQEVGSGLGQSVALVGDLDGDGLDDAVVTAHHHESSSGSPGVGYVLLSPLTAAVPADADGIWTGESGSNYANITAGAGDVDGDGHADFLMASNQYDSDRGIVYLVHGPATGSHFLASAAASMTGESSDDHAGYGHIGAGDLNGDAYADLYVYALQAEDSVGDTTGAAYLLLGPVSGALSLADADGKLVGSGSDRLDAVASGGDLNADGFDDVVVGMPHWSSVYARADDGGVFVFFGGPE